MWGFGNLATGPKVKRTEAGVGGVQPFPEGHVASTGFVRSSPTWLGTTLST